MTSRGTTTNHALRRALLHLLAPGRAITTAELRARLADDTAFSDVTQEAVYRHLDALARSDRRHPFGLCLRRSLLRYHFLRRAGLSLGITFGVRIRQPHEPPGLAGHAWNTLGGRPWCENEEDYRGFTVLYAWPPEPDQAAP